MKKKIFTTALLTGIFSLILVSINLLESKGSHSAYAFSSGAPGGNTNSPGDGANCTQCHTNAPLNNINIFTFVFSSNIPSGGYVPGQTYTISMGISNTSSSKIGFEATAERTSTSAKEGTMVITDAARTKTTNAGAAVTHTAAGATVVSAGANAWQFDWTAPSAGTGQVTFYGIYNVTNSNLAPSGDELYTQSFKVEEDISTGIDEIANNSFSIFPNPAVNEINVKTNGTIQNLELFNTSGQIILSSTSSKIDLSNTPSGVYFVKALIDGETSIQKVIKH
jgi:hypothetical protein